MPYRVCCSAISLKAQFEVVRRKVSLQETGTSWDTIQEGIVDLTEFSGHGGCKFPTEMVAGIRSISKSLNHALNSERSRLSGSVIELLVVLSAGLGSAFEPLVSLFMPRLLGLCARTNKVFVSRAKACIVAVIKHTQLSSILPHLAESVHHKSASLRLVAAEGVIACLNCFNPPDDSHAHLIKDVIKLTSRDASANVRAAGKKILEAYRALLHDSVESRKQSEVQGTAASRLTQVPRCRPTTGRTKPIVSSALKLESTLRIPSKSGPSSVQNSNQPRDVVAPTAKRSQRVGNKGMAVLQLTSRGLSRSHQTVPSQPGASSNRRRDIPRPVVHTVQRPQRVWKTFVQPNLLPGTDDAEIARTARPLPVNPSSVGSLQKSVISQSDPKNNPITAKMDSVNPTSATIIKPSSRTGLLPFAKVERPATRGTSSRIVRSHRLPTEEVMLQTTRGRAAVSRLSQQATGRTKPMSGVRPIAKGTEPIVKVLSNPCVVENPRTRKPAPKDILPPSLTATVRPATMPQLSSSSSLCIPRRSCRFEPAAPQEPPVPAITHDALAPREAKGPSCAARHLRRAAWQPCRRQSRIKIPLTSFLSCTPRRSISSSLAPLRTPEAIARTHSPSSLCIISCSQGCEMRHILQNISPKLSVSSTAQISFVAVTSPYFWS